MPFIPPQFELRGAQTRIKHLVLGNYAGAWVGIITTGRRQHPGAPPPSFVFIDAFAGAGRYGRDADKASSEKLPIWGSPVIAPLRIQGYIRERNPRAVFSVLLIEKKPLHFAALTANLEDAPLLFPRRVVTSIREGREGEVSLLHADFRHRVDEVIDWIHGKFALILIDPWGDSMPLHDLMRLAGRRGVDALIFFPSQWVIRLGPSAAARANKRSRENHERLTRLYGDERWVILFDELLYPEGASEAAAAELYAQAMRERATPELIVKSTPITSGHAARVAYHLVLTTHNEAGAIRMNRELRRKETEEFLAVQGDYLERLRSREEAHPQGSLDLGVALEQPPAPQATAFSAEEVADAIALQCGPGTFTKRQVWRKLADTLFLEDEIARGLAHLKSKNQAEYKQFRAMKDIVTLTL